MKTLKISLIAAIVTALIIALCGVAIATASAEDLHTEPVMVIECEQVEDSLWLISCIAKDGNIWQFYEDLEPWEVGDLATLIMWKDEVIDVEYTDHLEGLNILTWLP